MTESRQAPVSRILDRINAGELDRAEELLPLVYEELRRLARVRMEAEPAGQTVQATALVHEAYLRLVGSEDPGWNGRRHFFGAAAQAMRRILIERARRKGRIKHGGGLQRRELDDLEDAGCMPDEVLIQIDEAIGRLEKQDPQKGQIVNLRYFAGLSNQETADALGVSLSTVERQWRFLKAWLRTELPDPPP